MYDAVLLPVAHDEDDTDPAIAHAIDLATTYGATLHVVSVVDSSTFDAVVPTNSDAESTVSNAAEETLERVADRARAEGLTVETYLGRGSPHGVITAYADDNDLDLVVMATHGREGLDRTLLGSVTEKVVRRSETPVLTVPNA